MHKVSSALDAPSGSIGDGLRVSGVAFRRCSHIRYSGKHRKFVQCSFTIVALFVPPSSFMVDTLGIECFVEIGRFFTNEA